MRDEEMISHANACPSYQIGSSVNHVGVPITCHPVGKNLGGLLVSSENKIGIRQIFLIFLCQWNKCMQILY